MFTITRLENPPPESIKSQIMQMVIDYVTDIGMVGIVPSNPCTRFTSTASASRSIATRKPWTARWGYRWS